MDLHVDEKLRRPLPDDEAQVKILGAPGDYHVDWWAPTTTEDWTRLSRARRSSVIATTTDGSHLLRRDEVTTLAVEWIGGR
ncbi:hypothetical protein C9J85_03715 [Haloferax sp. wsp5]|nr:hypothetical protein C9J85_03715 [Haloferax sp. wsp5]